MRLFRLLVLGVCLSLQAFAQKQAPENWFNLDKKADKMWGVSTEKAYKELPIGKNPTKIIVAVIDAGTDIDHEDLKSILWVNPNEIPANGIDDDKNGYVDDINGWNFIGGKDGNVNVDTYEYTRILASYIKQGLAPGEIPTFKSDAEKARYEKATEMYEKNFKENNGQYEQFKQIMGKLNSMVALTGTKNPTLAQIEAIPTASKEEQNVKMILKYIMQTGGMKNSPIIASLKEAEEQLGTMVNYNLNKNFDPRNLVGDNYEDLTEKYYGNNQINAPNMDHGTHVAGIIAANRNNDIGVKGICDKAVIMTLRVVPNGDERDKDIANAIIYAVDNGAKVINMSFGKKLSPNKGVIDNAVKYALSKDVLFVHAAGNEAEDLNENPFYPMRTMEGGSEVVPNWIEVGASGWGKGKARVATFSNYGQGKVDLFAPGVDVNSTMPGSLYKSLDGTSMASPVVAGVAALVRQNYPNLTAAQTRQILMMSAVPCKEKIIIPGTKRKAKLKEICISGGIVNAYEALLLADKVTRGEVKLP